ncbi:KHSRP [Symbiodinium natans]|uniref:KHSRP protein n=1 Tax=Symbiodinium natans TaxID=878477 RepID=A0A812PKU1_9DINO|nr:KHSRP [Symbiodinium natans]
MPVAAAGGADERPRKKSKWDQTGPGGLPDWLADLAPKEPRAPPGVDPGRFKIMKMEAVQIRALIGKGGETVQEIRRNSGSEVKIDHQPTDPFGTVTIIGDLVKTEAMIQEALNAKGCPLGVPARVPATPGTVPTPTPVIPGAPGQPREISVPSEVVGGLIGPGGSVINDIRQRAGGQCHISVLQPQVPGGPQVCRITGPEELLQQAEELVQIKLNELLTTRGIRPSGGAWGPTSSPVYPQGRPAGMIAPNLPLRPAMGIGGAPPSSEGSYGAGSPPGISRPSHVGQQSVFTRPIAPGMGGPRVIPPPAEPMGSGGYGGGYGAGPGSTKGGGCGGGYGEGYGEDGTWGQGAPDAWTNGAYGGEWDPSWGAEEQWDPSWGQGDWSGGPGY